MTAGEPKLNRFTGSNNCIVVTQKAQRVVWTQKGRSRFAPAFQPKEEF